MQKRSLFQKIFGGVKQPQTTTSFKMVNSPSAAFYNYNGEVFESDIVRSAIRPKANAAGKLHPIHKQGEGVKMKINPSPSIRKVLEQPNPYMSMQDFICKMVFQREISHNAFAYVKRDPISGMPVEIYPVPFQDVELVESQSIVFAKFSFLNGSKMVVPYDDCIHLRKDFYSHDMFGDSGTAALYNIMEVISTTDQGMIHAIKNSAVIKWIMMFKSVLRKEDKQEEINKFMSNYMNVDNAGGVAASDPRYDLKQVEDKPYVPNAIQMEKSIQRLYKYFGVNDKIVQNNYTEDEFNSFYESEIEPIALGLTNGFSKIFFTPTQRSYGNKIIFEANNLAYANMSTKLLMVGMVDRGALTPNEWRSIMNLGPIEGGEDPIRRLDTQPVAPGAVKDPITGGDTNGNKSNG